MMKKRIIYGVHVTDRMKEAVKVQKLLTEYGCHIKTRIGLHNVSEDYCSSQGLMLLEMFGDEKKCAELFDKLAAIEGIEMKKMVFKCC